MSGNEYNKNVSIEELKNMRRAVVTRYGSSIMDLPFMTALFFTSNKPSIADNVYLEDGIYVGGVYTLHTKESQIREVPISVTWKISDNSACMISIYGSNKESGVLLWDCLTATPSRHREKMHTHKGKSKKEMVELQLELREKFCIPDTYSFY